MRRRPAADAAAANPSTARLERLLPPGPPIGAEDAFADWPAQSSERAGHPLLAVNMIASVDGRVTLDGRSGGLGGPVDRALFHALRARCDAIMVGASTARIERYGPLIKTQTVRARRVEQGLGAQPLAVIVSRRLDLLEPSLPLLADPQSSVVVVTAEPEAKLASCAAKVSYLRTTTLEQAVARLHTEWGVSTVLCEGGPRLNARLLAEGLIDELFMSISPMLVGGATGPTVLSSHEVGASPVALRLSSLLACDSELYARYSVCASVDA